MAAINSVPQGTLSRLRGAVLWAAFPALNVTAPFLGPEGISLGFEGNMVDMPATLTGVVTSPAVFVMARVTMQLLKTQGLSDSYKQQWELDARLGDCTVRPDTTTLGPFQFSNCAIENVDTLLLNGSTPALLVRIMGQYQVNAALWNL
jgi:hypothetical protein